MRTFTHNTGGPCHLDLSIGAGGAEVKVEDRDDAEVTVSVEDADAAELVEQATCTRRPDRLSVTVPRPRGTVFSSGTTTIVQTAGTVVGSMVGALIVDGGLVISGGAVVSSGGRVRVTARLPRGSSVTVSTDSGDVVTWGDVPAVEFQSTSGGVVMERVGSVRATTISGQVYAHSAKQVRVETTSGDISVEHPVDVSARSISGDVTVAGLTGHAQVSTTSGDIWVRAVADSTVTARSVSGDIHITAPAAVRVDSTARTVSGDVTRGTR